MRKLLSFHTLAARMNFILITMLACITLALGLTAYEISRSTIASAAIQRLGALAESQQTAIENQLQSYIDQTNIILKSDMLSMHLPLLDGEVSDYDLESLSSGLQRKKAAMSDILQIDILDKQNRILASTNDSITGTEVILDDNLVEGWTRMSMSNIYIDKNGENMMIDICSPILNRNGNAIALLNIRFNARRLIHITGNYAGLGDSGESLLAVRDGEYINFLTPLRFDPDFLNIGLVPISGERAKPMIHATAGQTGTVTNLDYRGVRVVAAYRQLTLTDWGLVVKMDEEEVFASIYRLQYVLVFIVILFLILGLAVTIPLVNNFVRPLKDMKKAIQNVMNGELNVKVPVDKMDEIGDLAVAFNNMTGELQSTQKDLLRRNEELSSFAYVVSHDLKAPLRGIHSLSGWIEEDLSAKLEEDQLNQIHLLRDRVMRMDTLINDLLEYSRAGQDSDHSSWVNVGELIGQIVEAISPPEGFDIEIDEKLPILRTDELHLHQIFQNLIDNAIKHHPGPSGNIKIFGEERETFWKFTVKDNGNGIEPRYHERVFQIFQTLNPGNDGDSTGIGLAVVKKIVENQGGEVWIDSDGIPGKGTAFNFTWSKE